MNRRSIDMPRRHFVAGSQKARLFPLAQRPLVVFAAALCLALIVFVAVREPLTSMAETLGLVEPTNPVDGAAGAVSSATVSLEVASLYQNPELPTGCESVALADLLLFWGFDLEKTTIADYWLPTSDFDFVNSFLGNPYDSNGNACMAPCIVKTANAYLAAQDSSLMASDLTGASLATLLEELDEGKPVIVWSTIGLEDAGTPYASQWSSGVLYNLYANSHCVVLSGYDIEQGTLTVADPLEGISVYDMGLFAQRFEQLGSQAVVIG